MIDDGWMADGQTDVWIDGWTEVRMDLSSKVNLIYIFNILILCYVMQSVLVSKKSMISSLELLSDP